MEFAANQYCNCLVIVHSYNGLKSLRISHEQLSIFHKIILISGAL